MSYSVVHGASHRVELGRPLAGRIVQPKVNVLRINKGGRVLKAGAESKGKLYVDV